MTDNTNLFEYNHIKNAWIKKDIFHLYKNLTRGVRGGINCYKNLTWFFKGFKMKIWKFILLKYLKNYGSLKGRTVWAYKEYNLVSGFPKRINDPLYPINPYTAVKKDGKFYLVKVQFWLMVNYIIWCLKIKTKIQGFICLQIRYCKFKNYRQSSWILEIIISRYSWLDWSRNRI